MNTNKPNDIDNSHVVIIRNAEAAYRRPYYLLFIAIISTFALIHSLVTFMSALDKRPYREYIPTSASDTPIIPIPLDSNLLPTPDQDVAPGSKLSEAESLAVVQAYMVEALRDCFRINHINVARNIARCKASHLDGQSSTPDDYAALLDRSGILGIINKHLTHTIIEIDEKSITLSNSGIASLETKNGIRKRFVWIFEVPIKISFGAVNAKIPELWEVEMIRESSFDKETPVSLFKIRPKI